MPVQEWPTLEQVGWFRAGDPLTKRALICDAAEWAVRVRPQLEALVAELDEWARAAAANKDAIAGTFVGLSYRLNEVIATPHEEHEERQG